MTFVWFSGKFDYSFKNFKDDPMTTEVESDKKAKTTIYMTEEEETLLNELFIKRLREKKKTNKSALFCEGIRLLFEKEIGDAPNA